MAANRQRGSRVVEITITEELAGKRADIGLTEAGMFHSRSQLKKIFGNQKVFINGKTIKPSYKLENGDQVRAEVPETAEDVLVPYDFPLDILHEDEELIVLNKPAGLVVHPANGHHDDTLINALLAHHKTLSKGSSPFRPGLVHRIDKDTSGLLVLAKTEEAHTSLAKQFARKTVHRIYHAVVFGVLKEISGSVSSYIIRSPNDRKKFMSSPGPEGKLAITHYEVLRASNHFSLVKLKLETGRTHQIRVHLSSLHHPVVGDDTYGGKKRAANLASQPLKKLILEMPRFALHAKELGFVHPRTHEFISFDSPWPDDLKSLLDLTGLIESKE